MPFLKIEAHRKNWRSLVSYLAYQVDSATRIAWTSNTGDDELKKIREWDKRLPGFSEFVLEVFARVYGNPVAVPHKDVAPEAIWAVRLHGFLDKAGIEEEALRLNGHIADSFLYAMTICEAIIKSLPSAPDKSETITAKQKLAQLKAEEAALVGAIPAAPADQVENLEFRLQMVRGKITRLEALGVTACAVTPEYAEALATELLDSINPAIIKAALEYQEFMKTMLNFIPFPYRGKGGDAGTLYSADPKARIELAKKLKQSSQFRRVAELVGRFRKVAQGKRESKKDYEIREEQQGTIQGQRLEQLHDSEIVRLADENLERQFENDYENGRLLLHDQYGQAAVGAGAMAILLDASDSMSEQEDGYTRWEAALAMGIALLGIAADEKRPASLIIFDSAGYSGVRAYNSSAIRKEKIWDSSGASFQELMELAEISCFGGGTDFVEPLERALENIKSARVAKDSHVIMVTDGGSHLDKDWIESYQQSCKDLGTKIHVLCIGGYSGHCLEWVDRFLIANSLLDSSSADVFEF